MNKGHNFLTSKNWEFQETVNQQYVAKVCPLCYDERWKFYMNWEGLWDCKICGESGNLYQLKMKLGGLDEISSTQKMFENKKELDIDIIDEYIENLENDKEAYEYLHNTRKFSDDIIKKFKLGVNNDWIAIPHFQDEKLWNIKMRNYKDKSFKRISGQPSVLFNIDNIDTDKKAIVIVESETDCIAATQMGITNVVGLTTGAASFLPEWISLVTKFKEIYICLNSDIPGQKGARKIADKIGIEKCRNVLLPTNDINDFLIENGNADEFYELVKNAKRFNVQNIKGMSDYIAEIDEWLKKDGSMEGLHIPFNKIDKYLNGFKGGDLIVLLGDTGVGKTTLAMNAIYHFIKEKHRCLGFFLEGKIMYYILRMMSMQQRIPVEHLKKDENEWDKLKKSFSDYPLYFYSGAQMGLDTDKLAELLALAVKMYDLEFVMIDNLQVFVKDDRQVVQRTSEAMKTLKNLAVDLDIPIFLVSHISKREKDRVRVVMHDAKSSSSIYQFADVILALWNNKKKSNMIEKEDNEEDDEEDVDMTLTIEKNRMGEGGKDVKMVFEVECAIYREYDKIIDSKKSKKETKRIIETLEEDKKH